MAAKKVRTCVLYTRISLRTEESVSIARQIEAGEAYALARGWKVVGVFTDEGVSATQNKPEVRKAWQALLTSRLQFDAVVIWKVDRLARRVIDFLNANEAVKTRGAGIVAVEDPIDMTTAQGEAFAIMLAVFGQMEAAAIRDRVTAARDYLLRAGRNAGGAVLYGYRTVPNPAGAGYLLAKDDEQIEYVREMVRRTLAGMTVYSTKQWLEEVGAPTPRGSSEWGYSTVDRILRHPLLAGMVPHNPGNTTSHVRGEDVVRGADGLPVVDESLAIMPLNQWRAMQAQLAEPSKPQRAPRALRRTHSGVLSGLMWCGDPRHEEPVRMWRGTLGTKDRPRPSYYCPECHQAFSNADDLVVNEFLAKRGDLFNLTTIEEVVEGGSVQMQEASIRLSELGREMVTATPDRAQAIIAELTRLKEIQEEARQQPAQVRYVPSGETRSFREDWEDATTDEERRSIIGLALDRVVVRRGARGAKSEESRRARLAFEWVPAGQVDEPSQEDLASWAEYDAFIARQIAGK
jgi:site-specific DNA recombinase